MELPCIDKVDWKLLREQKRKVANMVLMPRKGTPLKDIQTLEGILCLIDNIQDDAEKVLGSKVVFGK